MRIINGNTKQGQQMLRRAVILEGYDLRDVYANASDAKVDAYNACKARCEREGGWNFHICSHNTFSYSVAWFTVEGMRIETPHNSYLVRM